MNTSNQVEEFATQTDTIREAVKSACERIAPTWPLDQFITVNPYWGFMDEAIHSVASRIQSYSGSRMLMPRSFYRAQLKSGKLHIKHLQQALLQSNMHISMSDLLEHLEKESPSAPRVPLFTSIADSQRDLLHGMSISNFVTHTVSQHCASYFDHYQSSWETQHKNNLYQSWVHHAQTDRSPWLLMGIHKMRQYAHSLPNSPLALISDALQALPVPPDQWVEYLTALLMSINGWASWCSYERWQAQLSQSDDDHIVQLLAIRLAWEQFAFVHLLESKVPSSLHTTWQELLAWQNHSEQELSVDWIFQEALEISYQSGLCQSLNFGASHSTSTPASTPDVQAIFCIDVRSEVFRRALEACSDSIHTLGFAGFFGLPISYTPLGTDTARPQLPGLLAPKLCVTDTTGLENLDKQTTQKKQQALLFKSIWKDFRSSASSTFTFVESCGFLYVSSLLKRTLIWPDRRPKTKSTGSEKHTSLRPCILRGNSPDFASVHDLCDDDLCDLVAAILTNMGLTTGFARLILLTGHGSHSVNNPHAAGLDCGACGGHTGEVNARILAGLFNDTAIRSGLLSRGIAIPATTHALPALHNTTTDEVTIFDANLLPHDHTNDLARLQDWLLQAGHLARMERAPSLEIKIDKSTSANHLLNQFQLRSRDWSQVRPEWGLANNAAFLIAPRSLSRGINLQGRVFLHEYHSSNDPNGSVLEAIMTAPLLVTNWINMQYYASTVDNRLYGSGNKVLHNVVGGRLGVFEGNGGDLRIGLPIQSLHDGHTLRHTPLRLSVFIEAPQSLIDAILLKHRVVRNLVHNQWLHIFQITPGSQTLSRYRNGAWNPFDNHVPENFVPGGPRKT